MCYPQLVLMETLPLLKVISDTHISAEGHDHVTVLPPAVTLQLSSAVASFGKSQVAMPTRVMPARANVRFIVNSFCKCV